MNKPLVSIITVVYNGVDTLEQTIESVRNQSYKNIEYIIIDGGSTDSTISIVKKNSDTVTKWISEPDHGLYDAMNKGIKMANGDLIGMINSDDWYELDAIEIMVNAHFENPTKTIFHANRFDIDDFGNKTLRKFNQSRFKFKYYGMTYNHPSMFITRKEYELHNYNINLKSLSDYQFVLEALLRDSSVFMYVDNAIVNYRLDGISARLNFMDSMREGFISRQKAGLSLFENIFALAIRISARIFFSLKNKD